MGSWNSGTLEVTYQVLGWTAFTFWSVGFYPQFILNLRRKSVVGLNFDFVLFNFTKQTSYLIYNASMYFSSVVQKQYYEQYGDKEMIPVAANDVAFSSHAVLLTAIILFQVGIYERGSQKISKPGIGMVSVAWFTAAVCFFIALPTHSWLWLVSTFNAIQVCMTTMKYVPQVIMNFNRRSTDGFSIGNIVCDFSGSVSNYGQMVVQSIDQGSWVNFYGNKGKLMLCTVCVFFDIVFICQHYMFHPSKRTYESVPSVEPENEQIKEPLIRCSDEPEPEPATAADHV